MPGQARTRGAAANHRFGKDGMEIMHGVGLRRRRILPAETERAHALFHHADDVANLLRNALGAEVAVAHRALRVARVAFLRLAAARDHKARRRTLARPRKRKGVERRLGRRIDLRTDIAARHRIGLAVVNAPFRQRLDVVQVEIAKSLVGECRGRSQFAGAERRQRPARCLNVFCDLRKALGQRHQLVETHPLDLIAGVGRDTAGILEYGRNEPVIAGGKVARHVGPLFFFSPSMESRRRRRAT